MTDVLLRFPLYDGSSDTGGIRYPLQSKLGSLAMFAAMRLASSRGLSIALIGVAVHISDGLFVRVYDLEAAFDRFNSPWRREAPMSH